MQNAQKRNACLEQKFWFRKSIDGVKLDGKNITISKPLNHDDVSEEYELMTVNEIMNGKVN